MSGEHALSTFATTLGAASAWAFAHAELVNGVNMGLTAALAVVVLWMSPRVLPGERWPQYFGAAYAVLALIYALRAFAPMLTGVEAGSGPVEAIGIVLSAVNNVLFFAAAQALLARRRTIPMWLVATALITAILGSLDIVFGEIDR